MFLCNNNSLQLFLTKGLILLILRNGKIVFNLSIDLFFKSLLEMSSVRERLRHVEIRQALRQRPLGGREFLN
jgi:hypothetical protein